MKEVLREAEAHESRPSEVEVEEEAVVSVEGAAASEEEVSVVSVAGEE